jgi:hypothetical protein
MTFKIISCMHPPLNALPSREGGSRLLRPLWERVGVRDVKIKSHDLPGLQAKGCPSIDGIVQSVLASDFAPTGHCKAAESSAGCKQSAHHALEQPPAVTVPGIALEMFFR